MRRDDLALHGLFLLAEFLVDGRERVPRDADDGVDAHDLGQELDRFLKRARRVGLVRLPEEALDLGRGLDVGGAAAAALRSMVGTG